VLEHHADSALLRTKMHTCCDVGKDTVAVTNASDYWPDGAGNSGEREALPRTRRANQCREASTGREPRFNSEVAHFNAHIDGERGRMPRFG